MTTPLAALEERIAKLERASDEIREATRLAHEATKDLRAVIREAREILSSKPVEEKLDDAVKDGLAGYVDALKKATDDATAAVFARYDELARILLDSKKGGVSFEGIVQRAAAEALELREGASS